MLLGRQTYLNGKPGGESSMSGKPGCHEAVKWHARRGPDGTVKPRLVEPQCPNSNSPGRKGRLKSGCFLRRLG